MDRVGTSGAQRETAVRALGGSALERLLRGDRGERIQRGADAAVGRAVHAHTVVRGEEDDGVASHRGPWGEPQAGGAAAAGDGDRGNLPPQAAQSARTWASDLPVPVAGPPKKEKSKRDKKSEGNSTTTAPYPSQQRLTYSGPKTVDEWGTPQ